jgi:hypothetical protein
MSAYIGKCLGCGVGLGVRTPPVTVNAVAICPGCRVIMFVTDEPPFLRYPTDGEFDILMRDPGVQARIALIGQQHANGVFG